MARRRRYATLAARFPGLANMKVLDLGGEYQEWADAPVRPRELVTLNVGWHAEMAADQARRAGVTWARSVAGDACDPPAELFEEHFDLVFSNSVIEHVGGHARRIGFANAVHAVADHHWIQTPNRWFPLEPHYLCPGLQWLPTGPRAGVARRWPVGSMTEVMDDSAWPAPAIAPQGARLRSSPGDRSRRPLPRHARGPVHRAAGSRRTCASCFRRRPSCANASAACRSR
jgi:hypothetical protein